MLSEPSLNGNYKPNKNHPCPTEPTEQAEKAEKAEKADTPPKRGGVGRSPLAGAPTSPTRPDSACSVGSVGHAHTHQEEVARAIAETVAVSVNNWWKKLFAFARRLWSLPGVQGVPVAELKPVVRQWYEASRRAL